MIHSRFSGPMTRLPSAVQASAARPAEQQFLAEHEDHEAERHADAGEAEAVLPAEILAQIAAQDGRPERAQVDAVVVEGEAGIPARIALRYTS
jgi:non-ribosomal peptide synthetase component F